MQQEIGHWLFQTVDSKSVSATTQQIALVFTLIIIFSLISVPKVHLSVVFGYMFGLPERGIFTSREFLIIPEIVTVFNDRAAADATKWSTVPSQAWLG